MRTLRPGVGWKIGATLLLIFLGTLPVHASQPADWFPEQPVIPVYEWSAGPCTECAALPPPLAWQRMLGLAGRQDILFYLSPDDTRGPAYSTAAGIIVITPDALTLPVCQLAFIVGHEIVHIARRHFDEDALATLVYTNLSPHWSTRGDEIMQLQEGDFRLALRLSKLWQQQESEADWLGSLLAAQGAGCPLETAALPYLIQNHHGGGVAAAHPDNGERVGKLLPYASVTQLLVRHQQPDRP